MKKYICLILIIIIFIIESIITINKSRNKYVTDFHAQLIQYRKEELKKKHDLIVVDEEIDKELEEQQETIEETPQDTYEELYREPISDSYTTRMTSFWANDGYGTGECTGSGLCSWDFGINDKGWYIYQGKLVIATATTYLADRGWHVGDGVHLYKYWEELILTIDGVEYEAIILDSCGSSMRTDRVDLFVSNGSSAKDTMIEVRRK